VTRTWRSRISISTRSTRLSRGRYCAHSKPGPIPYSAATSWDLPGTLGTIDRSKLNVKGGSLAIGHPFAATGTRIVATLAKILDESRAKRGLISICTAGGMGVTAILER